MTLLTQERITTAERLSPQTVELFSNADELILDLQDSPAFAKTLADYNIPFDDTTSEYWQAVRYVAENSINIGEYADNKPLLQAMRIAAAAPDAAFKQYFLNNAEEYKIDYPTRQDYVYDVSRFNDTIRDYIGDNLDTPFDSFSLLLAESASKGVDRSILQPVAIGMKETLKGVRTELGLEQKAAAAGLAVRRGTTAEDMRGVDYVIDGVQIDVKSSLHSVLAASSDATAEKAYFIKNKKATIFPYDYVQDYEHNTFRLKEEIVDQRAEQLAKDIKAIKKRLA